MAKQKGINFQQPEISIPIPLKSGLSFLVEEAIIGPTVRDLFYRMFISKQCRMENDAKARLRDIIYEIEVETLQIYQDNFKDLTQIPTQLFRDSTSSANLPYLKSPHHIIEDYINKFVQAFKNSSKYTDTSFSEDDMQKIKGILTDYQFSKFITPGTIRRNMAASFRNSILRTNKMAINLRDLPKSTSKAELKKALCELHYRVDQPPKYSFMLEDLWEMLDFYEAQLPASKKEEIITDFIGQYPLIRDQLEEGNLPSRLFRNVRESGLSLSLYGLKEYTKFTGKLISEPEYNSKMDLYGKTIRQHNQIAIEVCKSLPQNHKLKGLLPYLERVGSFTTINYVNKTK